MGYDLSKQINAVDPLKRLVLFTDLEKYIKLIVKKNQLGFVAQCIKTQKVFSSVK